MIILDLENYKDQIREIKYSESFDWQCSNCGTKHHETEKRNFERRKEKCCCQSNDKRAKEINDILQEVNYKFLYEEPKSFTPSSNGKIECKKPILVQCLSCGKKSYEYFHNIKKEHKKCNCNLNKAFTRDLSVEEFVNKWTLLTRNNFDLISTEYKGRNFKYKIKCKKCGREDERWGISLIDNDNICKYCDLGSRNEQLISILLNQYGIYYIREYQISWNNHIHKFDFYLPKNKMVIEYNGKQHYTSIDYFGGEEQFKIRQERDAEKEEYCKKNNIQLIVFNYLQSAKDIEKEIGLIFND